MSVSLPLLLITVLYNRIFGTNNAISAGVIEKKAPTPEPNNLLNKTDGLPLNCTKFLYVSLKLPLAICS